jgi:TolB-like protein
MNKLSARDIMKTFIKILLFAWLIVNIPGCVGNNMESFVRPDTDLSFVKRVAVMPMQNNSKDAFVAERVRDMVITQLLANGMFDVVDKGLVDSALRDQAVNLSKGPMDAGVMKRLGQLLHV